MRVTIVTSLQTFLVEIGQKEAVMEIKRKIEQHWGIAVALQTLSVSGWELTDGLDMEDYPIVTEGTRIDLTIKQIVPPPCNKIVIVLTFLSKQFTIKVDLTETVGSLKEKIQIMEGTYPLKKLCLYFRGMELVEDFRNLSDYGIREFSQIIVHYEDRNPEPASRIRFVVQTSSSFLNGARIPLEMNDSVTVDEVKNFLVSQRILPRLSYFFIHKHQDMHGNWSLKRNGVENGDTLHVFQGTCRR
ncbi:hypothetical protein ACFE04_016347 [Oxalis oulophora]